MKKSLTLIILIGFISISFGQQVNQSGFRSIVTESEEIYRQVHQLALSGKNDIIWSEEFDGGIPGDWQIVDNNDFCTFQHTYESPQGFYSVGVDTLRSSTFENGFLIIDSDLCNSNKQKDDLINVDAYIQSPPINLSGYNNVVLTFEHSFRFLYADEGSPLKVLVSNDNINWVSFDVSGGVQSNHMSPNPVYQTINISDIAGGNESVWIRFHKSDAPLYYWMIDDVSLVAFDESELVIESVSFGGYGSIPGGQQHPLNLSANVFNDGSLFINNVNIFVDINDFLFNESSSTNSVVNPGERKEIHINKKFLPPAKGKYSMVFSFSHDLFEDELGTYVYKSSFWVTDTIYSRDDNVYTEGIVADEGDPFITGNRFDIISNTEATSIGVVLHHQTQPGAEIKGLIFEITDDDFLPVAQTSNYTVVDSDIPDDFDDDQVAIVLSFAEPVDLEAGKSYLVAVQYNGGPDQAVIAGSIGVIQPDDASFTFADDEWLEEPVTPLVRLYLGNNEVDCELHLAFKATDASCEQANGSIKVYPLTGYPPFSYEWNTQPVQYKQTATNLEEGMYAVTVTDKYGCQVIDSVEIADLGGTPPKLQYTVSKPAGCGGSDGSITIVPDGSYDYSWSTGHTGQNLENISAGTYMLTVTEPDDNCILDLTFYVNDGDAAAILAQVTDITCYGYSNGSIEVELEDEIDTPTFIWSTGKTGSKIQSLEAGIYSVTATDSGCMSMDEFVVYEPEKLLVVFSDIEHLTCHGYNTGKIDAEVTGGISPYNYYWNTGSTGESITDLYGGNYSLTVIDENNCRAEKSVKLEEPEPIEIVADEITEPTGTESNGTIKIIVTGGMENGYDYQWNHGPTTQNVTGLPAGTYVVTVTDIAECAVSKSFKIGAVGIEDKQLSEQVLLYPNPAESFTTIKFGSIVGNVQVRVNDIFGKLLYIEELYIADPNETYTLNTEDFASGVYFIHFKTAKSDFAAKLIVR